MCVVTDNPTHTPPRQVRVETELWDKFGEVAGERNRGTVLRDFIRWYVGEPDARPPARPLPAGRFGLDAATWRALRDARNDFAHGGRPGIDRVTSDEAEGLTQDEVVVLFVVVDADVSEAEAGRRLRMSRRRLQDHVEQVAAKVAKAGGYVKLLLLSPAED